MEDFDDWPIKELIEGTHYYLEDGLMVLTERSHLARGRCCGSGAGAKYGPESDLPLGARTRRRAR